MNDRTTVLPSINCSTVRVERPGFKVGVDTTVGEGFGVGVGVGGTGVGVAITGVGMAITCVGGTDVGVAITCVGVAITGVGATEGALPPHAAISTPASPRIPDKYRLFKYICTV